MLRSLLIAAFLVPWGIASAPAQEWARKMFDALDHDFGVVARGSKVEFSFPFTNIYEEDLHVASVRSSCGCAEPRFTADHLKTWEEAEIVAALNTQSFLGQRSATITVVFDQPYYAEVQLQVKGYIRSDIVLSPESIAFGDVAAGTTAEKRLTIDYAGRGDWQLTGIEAASEHLDVQLIELSRSVGSAKYELIVRMQPTVPPGFFRDELRLASSDRGGAFPVLVEGQVLSEVTVTPAPLVLGKLQPGETVTKKLVVRGTRPFRITNVDCDDDCFRFVLSDAAKPLHLVPVTFEAGANPGKVTAKVRLMTDLESGFSPEVIASAEVVAAGS